MSHKLLILGLVAPLVALHAADFTIDDAGTLTAYSGSATDVVIPDTVKSIQYGVFRNKTKIKSVTIPNSVTNIGNNAFNSCTALTSITIPDSVIDLGNATFYECSSLASVSLPNSITNIGDQVFAYCPLTSITIPNGVTNIGMQAFYNCSSLKSINIPNSVVSIGTHAFLRAAITDITVPDSVKSLGASAFSTCTSLKSITLPKDITSIEDSLFSNCYDLESVTIPQGVTRIGTYAFYRCRYSLTSITIPKNVDTIDNCAFQECTYLKSVEFKGAPPTTVGTGIFTDVTANGYYTSKYADEWSKVIVNGKWNGLTMEMKEGEEEEEEEEALPEEPEDVSAVMAKAADARLASNITTNDEYAKFRAWAVAIGAEDVMNSSVAWPSYALGCNKLIDVSDVHIIAFAPAAQEGQYDLVVSIKGARADLVEMFDVIGSQSLGSSFTTSNVNALSAEFAVHFVVAPKDDTVKALFFKGCVK